jgi:hypothetical protein
MNEPSIEILRDGWPRWQPPIPADAEAVQRGFATDGVAIDIWWAKWRVGRMVWTWTHPRRRDGLDDSWEITSRHVDASQPNLRRRYTEDRCPESWHP